MKQSNKRRFKNWKYYLLELLVEGSDYDNGIQLLKDSGYITDNTSKSSLVINTIRILSSNQRGCYFFFDKK